MAAIEYLGDRRRRVQAEAIAKEIDPQSGGYFREMLIKAALRGMALVSPQPSPPATEESEQ